MVLVVQVLTDLVMDLLFKLMGILLLNPFIVLIF